MMVFLVKTIQDFEAHIANKKNQADASKGKLRPLLLLGGNVA